MVRFINEAGCRIDDDGEKSPCFNKYLDEIFQTVDGNPPSYTSAISFLKTNILIPSEFIIHLLTI